MYMNNSRLLEGKNAVVTGCSRGIGKSIVEVLASNGSNLWACARTHSTDFENYLQDLSDKFNVSITPIYFDLNNKEEIKNAVKKIIADKNNVDILVNNAGITYNSLFQMSTQNKIEEVMNVNFMAPFLFTQYIVKIMLKFREGSIINISSSAALDGNAGRSVYGASKAALLCATKALAAELGDQGIRANVIAPGITETDMLESMSEEVIRDTVMSTDLKRSGMPRDIANAVLFLASNLSSYVTGQVLRVDGGM
jgi:3-oxoacyl-[acyl-carrier protein] reductase